MKALATNSSSAETPIPQHQGQAAVSRPPVLGPVFRELFTVPPNVRLEDGPYCPLDDVVLITTVRPAGLACSQCQAAWTADGRDGWWMGATARPARPASRRAWPVGVGMLLAGSIGVYTAGQEYIGEIPVPEWLIWATSAGLFAGVGLSATRQWVLRRRDQRGVLVAEPIADEDLDPEALALLTRIRDARRERREGVV